MSCHLRAINFKCLLQNSHATVTNRLSFSFWRLSLLIKLAWQTFPSDRKEISVWNDSLRRTKDDIRPFCFVRDASSYLWLFLRVFIPETSYKIWMNSRFISPTLSRVFYYRVYEYCMYRVCTVARQSIGRYANFRRVLELKNSRSNGSVGKA